MSETATPEQQLEFRCTQCWNSNCVSCELSGQSVQCCNCGADQAVPEATAQRIARATELLASGGALGADEAVVPDDQMSQRELQKLVQAECYVPSSQMDYSGAPLASCLARLFAQILDGLAGAIAVGAGLGLVFGLSSVGVVHVNSSKNPAGSIEFLAALFFPFLVLTIVQWNLIATRGQTLGKMLTCVRIVSSSGNPPGFIRGVILRSCLTSALGVIPFFGLLDVALILTESRRCIHDYLAGTRVVQA